MQHSLKNKIAFEGIGVHSGKAVKMNILPGAINSGIIFRRIDLPNPQDISANINSVRSTELCTIISAEDPQHYVMTIEHLLAAFSALGVDNAIVELTAAEVPIMDGSAKDFVSAILEVGLCQQQAVRKFLEIVEVFEFESNGSKAIFSPSHNTKFDIEIDFQNNLISRQRYVSELTAQSFCQDISNCRTFGFLADVKNYHAKGFALGSNLENSIVIDEKDNVLNSQGLRCKDEFARHKTLDAIGDLFLCGAPLLGAFKSYKGGHRLNVRALQALMANKSAWRWNSLVDMELPMISVIAPKLAAIKNIV